MDLIKKLYTIFKPTRKMKLSDWADENAYIPEGDPNAGKWHCLPYQKEILNTMTDNETEMVTVIKSARVGYTKMISNCLIPFLIDEDPCSIQVVQPTVEDAQGYSKEDLQPALDGTPKVKGKVSDVKSRSGDNTILLKKFTGGVLALVGANSARGFRRVSRRFMIFDEPDGYPQSAGAEGDQIKLGIMRTQTFYNRKIILGSTPTNKGLSRIEDSYEKSDKRKYFVPCPFCNKKHVLKFGGKDADFGFKWEKDKDGNHLPETTKYMCEHCHKLIGYEHQRWMVEHGEWIAEKPFKGHAGFHIWAAYSYSPNATWEIITKEFLECGHDPLKLKTFVNTVLGETWEDEGLKVEHSNLYLRREKYPAPVPDGGLILVCSVDVQDDRLEAEVNAYGIGSENWAIDYFVIFGRMDNLDGPWKELDNYLLNTTFRHQSGLSLKISCTTIDSGGHYTDAVYKFCKNKVGRRIFAIKGSSTPGKPLVSRPSTSNKGKVKLFSIGTDTAKETIYARLQMEKPGAGYMHFPMAPAYDEEYFKQLTAEKAITVYKKGFPYREWHQTRARNEALDLKVYALAALTILNPNFKAISKSFENKIAEQKKETVKKNPAQRKQRRRSGNSYINDWKKGL